MKKKKGKEGTFKFPFFRLVVLKGKRGVFPGIYRVSLKNENRDLLFSPSRSNLGLVSSRLVQVVANREI